MVGLGFIKLNGMFLIGKDFQEIKADKPGEKDGGFYKLNFTDGAGHEFRITCGLGWDTQVAPDKVVHFDPSELAFGQQYDITLDPNNDKGYTLLKVRTWKHVGNMASPSSHTKSDNKDTGK